MNTVIIDKDKAVVYQTSMDGIDEMFGEPALVIRGYDGMVEIKQVEDTILVNHETIETLVRIMRAMQKDKSLYDCKL